MSIQSTKSKKVEPQLLEGIALSRAEREFAEQAIGAGYRVEEFRTKTGKLRAIVRGFRCMASALEPNHWNYNEPADAKKVALKESIDGYGFVTEIICRVHPDKSDPTEFQIIDGEQRFNKTTLREVVPINVLLGYSESEIEKLTVITNETPGDANQMKLAALIGSIRDARTPEDEPTSFGLPFSIDGLEEGEKPESDDAEFSVNDYFGSGGDGMDSPDESSVPKEKQEWTTIRLSIPAEAMEVIERAKHQISEEVGGLHADNKLAYGRMLELLSAHYLG